MESSRRQKLDTLELVFGGRNFSTVYTVSGGERRTYLTGVLEGRDLWGTDLATSEGLALFAAHAALRNGVTTTFRWHGNVIPLDPATVAAVVEVDPVTEQMIENRFRLISGPDIQTLTRNDRLQRGVMALGALAQLNARSEG